jgi:uncharacterized membrane protein SpoIIM required for sporulation
MTSDGMILAVQIAAAFGILAFWQRASAWSFDEPWRPPGFERHERSFRLPDTVTALLLLGSALMSGLGYPSGRGLALVAAGMLLFLGLIDAAYMAQNGLFARERDGRMHLAIVVVVLGVAALLCAHYLP